MRFAHLIRHRYSVAAVAGRHHCRIWRRHCQHPPQRVIAGGGPHARRIDLSIECRRAIRVRHPPDAPQQVVLTVSDAVAAAFLQIAAVGAAQPIQILVRIYTLRGALRRSGQDVEAAGLLVVAVASPAAVGPRDFRQPAGGIRPAFDVVSGVLEAGGLVIGISRSGHPPAVEIIAAGGDEGSVRAILPLWVRHG